MTFDDVMKACRAVWGPPESDTVHACDYRVVTWPRAAGDPSKGGISLCESEGHTWINASPDWSPENEDYDRARAWSVIGEPFDADDAPVTSVGDAIFAAGRFMREHGGPMPMPDPYDPDDMPSRGYDR